MIKPYLMDFNDCKIALDIQPYSCLQNGFLHSHSYNSFYDNIYELSIKAEKNCLSILFFENLTKL